MRPLTGFLVLLVVVFAAPGAYSSHPSTQPVLGPSLVEKLQGASAGDALPVVISFWHGEDRSLLDGLAPHHDFRTLPMASAALTPAQIQALASDSRVRSIWDATQRIPLQLAEGRELVQAPQATAKFGVTGAGVTVAVIDTGVDTTHPDLDNGKATNIQVLPPEETGAVPVCVLAPNPNTDDDGHGTHVAGTIAGTGELSNGTYTGVAPGAKIRMYDANVSLFLTLLQILCSYDDIIATKAETGVRHISNSWGGGQGSYDRDDPIEIAVKAAYDNGIVSVFAASNDGWQDNTMSSQSVSPRVLAVAAITKKKQIAAFSSRGRPLDWSGSDRWAVTHDRDAALAQNVPLFRPSVSAPGVNITAPVPCGGPACTAGTGYETLSGTSMATPHVSGVIALMLERNATLSARQIIGIVEGSATVLPDWLAHETGSGLVNALKAVELARTGSYPKPTLDESLTSANTSTTTQGPVLVVGSTTSASPSSASCALVCKDFFVSVPQGATRLRAKVEWTNLANNFYAFAFAPGQAVTDFPTQEDAGLLDTLFEFPLKERVIDVRYPAPGQWRIRVLPRVNTEDSVSIAAAVSAK
jgi:serine protease AprX